LRNTTQLMLSKQFSKLAVTALAESVFIKSGRRRNSKLGAIDDGITMPE
jgi:hypothetical protein